MLVLDELADAREPVVLAVLAERVGLPKSTTRRVLGALEHHRLVERLAHGKYRLGLRLFELGLLVQGPLEDVRASSLQELQRLSDATGLTSYLCVQDGSRAVCVERVEGLHAHSMALSPGRSLPLHVGAASRALMASQTEAQVEAYIAAGLMARGGTAHAISTPERLRDELRVSRERGWTFADQEGALGVAAIGACIFDAQGAPCAAISVSGLVTYVTEQEAPRYATSVVEAARVISAKLGYTSDRDARGMPR
jgi:DNA-binding IclR family transcriptional regulator